MTPTQNMAFQAGSGVIPSTLLIGIASVVLVLAFIWVTLGTFRAWRNGQVVLFDVIWSALRASIVLMVLGFYLRWGISHHCVNNSGSGPVTSEEKQS